MNIKDVLHYYIPCRVQVDGKEWGQLVGFSMHPECEQYLWDIVIDGDEDGLSMGMPYNDDFSESCRVKPVLKPLSAMMEGDMRSLYGAKGLWAYIPQSHIKKIGFNGDNKNCIKFSYDGPEGGAGWRCGSEYMYLNQLWPAQFHYLLQQGYDLFGLIENGQAVDVTKIN